jgi:oxygen-independent coproporphyrinogen-3 oxidase
MPFGLYLHFPICRHQCAYCDFYKEIHDPRLEERFYTALRVETELVFEAWPGEDYEIGTIYIGGGTPSLTSLGLLADWLALLRRLFNVRPGTEFSFEANPESVSLELLEGLQVLGVNRPVFGFQTFNKRLLKLLGRQHKTHDAHRAVYLANALGYDNWGGDLIYALPKQTARMLSTDLDHLVDLNPPHISLYELAIEPGTPLADKVAGGKLKMPDDELKAALGRGGYEYLIEAGYERYEVCSFARPGHECQHNLGYWQGNDYLGLGPSAHSYLNGRRFANTRSLTEYVERLSQGRRPIVVDESGVEQRIIETIMLGFRTAKGIDLKQFRDRFGSDLNEHISGEELARLIDSGHIIKDNDSLRLSDDAMFLADEITGRLMR